MPCCHQRQSRVCFARGHADQDRKDRHGRNDPPPACIDDIAEDEFTRGIDLGWVAEENLPHAQWVNT